MLELTPKPLAINEAGSKAANDRAQGDSGPLVRCSPWLAYWSIQLIDRILIPRSVRYHLPTSARLIAGVVKTCSLISILCNARWFRAF